MIFKNIDHLKPLIFGSLAFIGMIVLQVAFRSYVHAGNDLYFPICGANALLDGADPYANCKIFFSVREWPQNPMTTILAVLPFARLGVLVGGIVFFSFTVGLLVYGILKNGKPWQLLIFTSFSFWYTAFELQWSVWMAAIFMLPTLLPLALVKPQTALPLVLTKLNRKRLIGILVFFLVSVVVYPSWMEKWILQAFSTYDGGIPVITFPALILMLVMLNWRDPDSRFLGLMALTPQRGVYDQTVIWLLLKSPRQMIILSGFSWLAFGIWRLYPSVNTSLLAVVCLYLPAMLITINWRYQINRARRLADKHLRYSR